MKTQKIIEVWDSFNPHLANQVTKYNAIDFNRKLSVFFCPGPFYSYVFDFAQFKFSKVSDSYQHIIGLDPETLTMDLFLSRIHPEDLDFFSRCEQRIGKFLFEEIDTHQILDYKVSYCFRIRISDGTYRLFLHQAMGVTLDDSNKLGMVLGIHSDISHITQVNNKKLSFFGLGKSKSFTNIDVYETENKGISEGINLFTKREIEIIRLLSEGADSNEIATILAISSGTVKKHRENILNKAKVKNTVQLIAMVVREGWI